MSGKYQTYDEYKDSGVEWIGRIPKEWELWKLTHAYDEIGSGTTPPSGSEEWYGGGVPWITTGELRETEIISTAKSVTEDALKKIPTLRKYPKGSIAIAMYGATIGRLGILGVEATTNQACCVLTKSNVVHNKYLYYWLQAFKQDIVNLASGGGQPNINQEVVASLKISSPEISCQSKIANFLDHETAKIDTLIEKQQQLIKLLKEKRQAVISHAVTKGLNPNAPMRDSGVEWFDQLPEHWKVGKLGYYANISNGATPSRENPAFWEGGNIGWLNSSKVNDVRITEAEQFITPSALSQTSVQPVTSEDLVMAITGEGQTRGRVAICLTSATINQHLAAISIIDRALNFEFLFYFLTSQYERIRHESSGAGSTKGAITCGDIVSFPLTVPPEKEQRAIVGYVTEVEGKFESLIKLANDQVDLLQERRSALISAAVTGKIDVRNWTSSEGTAA